MSLVNDMLNDLEQRRQQQPPAQPALAWLMAAPREPLPQRRWWLALVAALLIVVLLLVSYQLMAQREATAAVNDEPVASVSEPALAASWPQIVSVSQQRQPDRLVLRLSQAVPVTVSEKTAVNGRSLVLGFSALANTLPAQTQQLEAPFSPPVLSLGENNTVLEIALPESFDYQLRQVSTLDAAQPLALVITLSAKEQPAAKLNAQSQALASPAATVPQTAQSPTIAVIEKTAPVKKPRPLSYQQRDKRAVAEANNLLSLGQPLKAEQALRSAIGELQSENYQAPQSVAFLAAALMQQQRLAEAESLLRPVATEPQLVSLLARVQLLQGQATAALDLLRQQQPAFTGHQDYYALMALVAQQAGEAVLSQQLYQQLLQSDSSRGDWWAGLAIAKEQQGLNAQARQDYYRALQARSTRDALRRYAEQRYQALAGAKHIQELQ